MSERFPKVFSRWRPFLDILPYGSEYVSLTVGILSLVISRFASVFAAVDHYGPIRGILLETVFLQARTVIDRVRTHVTNHRIEDARKEAWSIRKSYEASFNMIAIAICKGAIVAQIAITAISLDNLKQTHWTVEAAFVISLISGCLSVYFACVIQLQLGSLHSREDLRSWLVTPHISKDRQQHRTILTVREQASYNAALMLVAPSQLLNWSLSSFLAGIGIYYGLVYTKDLGTLQGMHANLAVLLVYVMFTTSALLTFFLPSLSKMLETTERYRERLSRKVDLFNSSRDDRSGGHGVAAHDVERSAGNEAISEVSIARLNDAAQRRIIRDDDAQQEHLVSQEEADRASGIEQESGSTILSRGIERQRETQYPSINAAASIVSQERLVSQRTMATIDALQASIMAQKASLLAQETLLERFQSAKTNQ